MLRMARIRPLLMAWGPVIIGRIAKSDSHLGPAARRKLANLELKEKRLELFKKFGISSTARFTPLLQLPAFIVLADTIRRMCGTSSGFLGFLAEKFGGSGTQTTVIHVEDSMATEGGLWFPNLLIPDPMLILPAALSVLLFYNASRFSTAVQRAGMVEPMAQVVLSRSTKAIAIAMFPIALNLPSGLLLYWISSTLSATMLNWTMRILMPMPHSPVPCKPPVKSYMKDVTT